jgi:hypothetical protein
LACDIHSAKTSDATFENTDATYENTYATPDPWAATLDPWAATNPPTATDQDPYISYQYFLYKTLSTIPSNNSSSPT